jgi:hypothetical protein
MHRGVPDTNSNADGDRGRVSHADVYRGRASDTYCVADSDGYYTANANK